MARQIFAAEISHEDTPLLIREKLASDEASVKRHLSQLAAVMDEVFILSTCNRFTVYAIGAEIAPLQNFFGQYPVLKGYVQFYYNTDESITHLFAVASGLLSPIKGDHHILEQLQRAHRWAVEVRTIGVTLDKLINEAIRVGQKVRTDTGIDKFCCSVVDAGIELLYDRVDNLHHKRFLIIGTGKVARMALKYLYNEGIQNITIVSQDLKRAEELAELYYAKAVSMENLHLHVLNADVIIGGTHYEVSLFPESFLSGFYEMNKMWIILDFGMPRNFNTKLAEHSSIELYNLDDLKRLYKSPLDAFGGIESAWNIVMREAKTFLDILLQLEFSPILVAYWNRLADVKSRRPPLNLPRLDSELSPGDVEKIKEQTQMLIRNIAGDPWRNARILANNHRADDRDVLRDLIRFDNIKLNLTEN